MQAAAEAERWALAINWNDMAAPCKPDLHFKGAFNPRQALRAQRKRLQVASFALVLRQILPGTRMCGPGSSRELAAPTTAAATAAAASQSAAFVSHKTRPTAACGPTERVHTSPAGSPPIPECPMHAPTPPLTPANSCSESCHLALRGPPLATSTPPPLRPVVVDFGSGSGNLTLPLAWLFPEVTFVAVDMKEEAVRLLRERAQAADLTNVTAVLGCIESYRCSAWNCSILSTQSIQRE
jgi:hypothetical protein